jgi:hypothetical protein
MANSKISALISATTPLAGTEVLPVVQSSTTKQVAVSDLTAGRAVSALSLAVTQGITGGSGYQVSGFTSYRASGASASSPGDASMYYNSTTGQTFQARAGSSYDWSLINPGNANYIAQVPTGTLDFRIAGGNVIQGTAAKGFNFTANTPAAGMTSQLLNWYEEGTWTPTYSPASGAFTSVTYNTNTYGRYTRIGRMVSIQGIIITDGITVGTAAGNIRIAGLPFGAAKDAAVGVGYAANFNVNNPSGGYVSGSVLFLTYRLTSNGATSISTVSDLSIVGTFQNYLTFSTTYIV